MRLLQQNKFTKIVRYLDQDVEVPLWVKYLVLRTNGQVIGYSETPYWNADEQRWYYTKRCKYDQVAAFTDIPDGFEFFDSLREV